MLAHVGVAAHTGITKPVKLFGVRERSFNRLFSPSVEASRQRLDMRAVGVQNFTADETFLLCLVQYLLKDLLRDIIVAKTALSIYTDRRMIRYLFR